MRKVFAVVVISAALLLSVAAQAQSVVFLAAGSSAMFNAMAYTATVNNSQGYVLCGPNVWTQKNGAQIVDSRAGTGTIPNETGNVWITWNGNANGTGATKICAYVSVDSAVGVRAAMAVPTATIHIVSAAGTAGGGIVPNLPNADSPLPSSIAAALEGQAFQEAATDVRPEDAKFATVRALSPLGGALIDPNPTYNTTLGTILFAKGLGYASSGNANIGNAIVSSQSTSKATPVNFSLFGKDPFGSNPAAPSSWVTIPVGAAPVVVFANTTNTASGHLGDGNCTNINTASLCGMLDGTLQRNVDACEPASATPFGIGVFIREPLSGTYNTTEFATTASFQCFSTQERNVDPVANNPLNQNGAISGNFRARVVGTGEMVKTVAKTADSIGYAFWGYGNFSASNNSAPTNTKYLTVDGVDPLYANGGNPNGQGVFPVPSGSTFPVLTFPNIQNGSYRIWTTYRLVVPNLGNYSWANLFASIAQSDAATIYSDFIPYSSLNVLHDHFYQSNIGPYNDCSNTETGGDMGGLVYTCTQVKGYPAANGGATLIQKHM